MSNPITELGPPPFFTSSSAAPPSEADWILFRGRVAGWLHKAETLLKGDDNQYEIPEPPTDYVSNPTDLTERFKSASQMGIMMAEVFQQMFGVFGPASAAQSQAHRSRAPSPIQTRSPESEQAPDPDPDTGFIQDEDEEEQQEGSQRTSTTPRANMEVPQTPHHTSFFPSGTPQHLGAYSFPTGSPWGDPSKSTADTQRIRLSDITGAGVHTSNPYHMSSMPMYSMPSRRREKRPLHAGPTFGQPYTEGTYFNTGLFSTPPNWGTVMAWRWGPWARADCFTTVSLSIAESYCLELE